MAYARQGDKFGILDAASEFASQDSFWLHFVSIAHYDRSGNVDVSNLVADVDRHTFLGPRTLRCGRSAANPMARSPPR